MKVNKVSKTLFLRQKITIIKNTCFNYKIKTEIKTTTTLVIKNELIYSPMS